MTSRPGLPTDNIAKVWGHYAQPRRASSMKTCSVWVKPSRHSGSQGAFPPTTLSFQVGHTHSTQSTKAMKSIIIFVAYEKP